MDPVTKKFITIQSVHTKLQVYVPLWVKMVNLGNAEKKRKCVVYIITFYVIISYFSRLARFATVWNVACEIDKMVLFTADKCTKLLKAILLFSSMNASLQFV